MYISAETHEWSKTVTVNKCQSSKAFLKRINIWDKAIIMIYCYNDTQPEEFVI